MSRFTVASTVFIALAGASLLTGCADASGSSAEVGKLQDEVSGLAARAKKLESTVETQRRQIAGLKDDIISIRADQQNLMDGAIGAEADVVAAAGGTDEAGGMAAAATDAVAGSPEALERLFESEAGQRAIDLHIKKANERREKERWSRMVDGMVDRFAEQADLTDDQVVQMKDIMSKGTDQMRELWTGVRGGDSGEELSREERAQRMEEARAKTEEIRTSMDDQVKSALSSQQYDQYKEMSDRMGRFMGGGGRRGGGGGR